MSLLWRGVFYGLLLSLAIWLAVLVLAVSAGRVTWDESEPVALTVEDCQEACGWCEGRAAQVECPPSNGTKDPLKDPPVSGDYQLEDGESLK